MTVTNMSYTPGRVEPGERPPTPGPGKDHSGKNRPSHCGVANDHLFS
jgi:hypothetical protein